MAKIVNGWRHGQGDPNSDPERGFVPICCTVVLDKIHVPPLYAFSVEGEFGSSTGNRVPQPAYRGSQRNQDSSNQQNASKRTSKIQLQDRMLKRKASFKKGVDKLRRVQSDAAGAQLFDPNESNLGCSYSEAGGSFKSKSIKEPKYMCSSSVTCRIGKEKDRWLWVDTLQVEDLGIYLFKGVTGSHNIVSVKSKRLLGREFEPEIRKGKGEKVEPGKGLLFSIKLVDKAAASLVQTEDDDVPSFGGGSSWTASSEKEDADKVFNVRE